MGEMRNAYRIFAGKPERKRPFGRARRRRGGNNTMDRREIWESVDWMYRLRIGISGGLL
jgi:hypothetical protein